MAQDATRYNFTGQDLLANLDGTMYMFPSSSPYSGRAESDDNTLYLVNVGRYNDGNPYCFFNQGGHWGVEGELAEVGMRFFLQCVNTQSEGSRRAAVTVPVVRILMSTDGAVRTNNHLSYLYAAAGQDETGIIVDRVQGDNELYGAKGCTEWLIRRAVTGKNEFYISTQNTSYTAALGGDGERYLTAQNSAATGVRKDIVTVQVGQPTDAYGRWMFVSRQDLINRLSATRATYDDVADATFYLYDQSFARNNQFEYRWQKLLGTGEINIGNAQYGRGTDYKEYIIGTNPSFDYTYTTMPEGRETFYDLLYGQFNCAEIKGGTGTVEQTLTVPLAGWYMVTAQGFYRPGDNSAVRKAYLFAKASNADVVNTREWTTATLPLLSQTDRPNLTNLTRAGIKFFENRENYSVKTMVFLEAGQQLTVGISLDESSNSQDWVAFDNFQVKYMSADFVVSENFTGGGYYTAIGTQSYKTMILERTFQLNDWNSLVLPVDLNKDQVTTAFGSDVRLSKLDKLSDDGNTIIFKAVDLNSMGWTDCAIQKNTCYLIYPVNAGSSQQRTFAYPGTDEYTTTSQLYNVPNVSFDPSYIAAAASTEHPNGSSSSLWIYPTMYYLDGATNPKVTATADGYVYVMNKGALTHYKKDFALKGLRWWISLNGPASSARMAAYDDYGNVTDESATTGIAGVEMVAPQTSKRNSGIYTIDGRKLSATDTKGLPSGLYIVDGKKVAVY
jgi:hypothetical protein